MKVLLDESLDVRFRHELVGHDAYTVAYMRWKGLRNGALLAHAAADGFEALITIDRDIEHQQNLATLPCAVFVLHAESGELEDLQPLTANLLKAMAQRLAKRFVQVYP